MAKKQMNYSQKSSTEKPNVAKKEEQTSSTGQSEKSVAVAEKPSSRGGRQQAAPTYDQIAERAKMLWEERGCPPDQDEKNWLDAEKQLRQELGAR